MTRRLGRALIARASTESTNDDAWDALQQGLADGVTVVADEQTRGRGRLGRRWEHAPGQGLALSVGLHLGCDARPMGAAALATGLALAEGLDALGVRASLKWPNDVLLGGRKLAGILCESRALPRGDAVVIGVGVNVRQRAEDFPLEIRELAASLALAGHDASAEDVAAAFLNAMERRWDQLQEGSRADVLAAWTARSDMWGRTVTVPLPGGPTAAEARRLDDDGALIVRLPSGVEAAVVAGDVLMHESGEPRA